MAAYPNLPARYSKGTLQLVEMLLPIVKRFTTESEL